MTTLPLLVALAEAGEQDEGPADRASPEGARRGRNLAWRHRGAEIPPGEMPRGRL